MLSDAIVWTIAGSDCTGGAGIQADTKTIHNLGAKACSVVTAVTAQNSTGVIEINAVSNDVLLSQLEALEAEFPARVIKIGLLANIEQIQLVARVISHYKRNWSTPPTVVYDPVAVASNGDNLTEEEIIPALKEHLLPLVDVLTPNNNELQRLTGVYVFSWNCLESAAQKALELGVAAVILKGGHIDIDPGFAVDYCHDGYQHFWLANERIDSKHTHGSGCTYASAVASLLAQGYLLRDAFTLSKAYINQAIRGASKSKGNYGSVWQGSWPTQQQDFPQVLVPGSALALELDWEPTLSCQSAKHFANGFTATDPCLGLYPVIDSLDWLRRLLDMGVKTIQYREKSLSGDALEQAIAEAAQLGREHQARLFINDHWQLAIKHQAYGVHLGQEDVAEADLQQIKAAGLRLGISTHGYYELLKAMEYQPSYLAVGAIFPTRTKNMTGQIQGINTLRRLVALNAETPLVAIGGIDLSKAEVVAQTGVDSIAVVTAITEADDPEKSVRQFESILARYQS